ncbi:hypothetical protein BYT27DRAFT_7219115 [Phlegmacium glaucopus]|nr:hypothetical protein BYT27DRAFT_7219115 [Phlegmacium glaucopus]
MGKTDLASGAYKRPSGLSWVLLKTVRPDPVGKPGLGSVDLARWVNQVWVRGWLGSGPNGWPGPDKMGSHILLGIGLGWNGWPARKYSEDGVWTKMGRNIFLGIGPGQNGQPVRKYSGD